MSPSLRLFAVLTLMFACLSEKGLAGDELAERVRQIRGEGGEDAADRVEVIDAVRRAYSQASLDRVIAALKTSLKDVDPRVRSASAKALGNIIFEFQKPCPLELVKALEDPDADVRSDVVGNLPGEVFPEGSFEIFQRCMKSSDRMVRNNMPFYVAKAGGNTRETISVLEEGAKDESRMTRHNSEIYLWQLQKNRGRIVRYGLATIDERRDVPGDAVETEESRRQLTANIMADAMSEFLGRLADDEPVAFAKLFVEETKSPRIEVRRGAAKFFTRVGRLPRPIVEALIETGVEEAVSMLASDAEESVRKEAEEAAKELRRLRKMPL